MKRFMASMWVSLLRKSIISRQKRKAELREFAIDLLNELYENELEYTEDLYDQVGLSHDVKKFIRYNANKALMNLGFDPYFEEEDINPIVLNGLNTKTKSHDFFSMKGNGYKKRQLSRSKTMTFILR